jgi:RES domain-containing protein
MGRRVVYTSGTLSLAALEILVHTDEDLVPSDLVHIEIEVPDDLETERIDPPTLPRNWRAYPAPSSLQKLGANWIERGHTAVLRVPSAVIPQESNYLLNPEHPDATRFRVVTTQGFVLDPRLFH